MELICRLIGHRWKETVWCGGFVTWVRDCKRCAAHEVLREVDCRVTAAPWISDKVRLYMERAGRKGKGCRPIDAESNRRGMTPHQDVAATQSAYRWDNDK